MLSEEHKMIKISEKKSLSKTKRANAQKQSTKKKRQSKQSTKKSSREGKNTYTKKDDIF